MSTATHYPLNLAAIETIVDASGTNPVVAALCNGYVRSAAHQYADDLTGELSGSGYARAEIVTPTLTADGEALVLSGTDPEFASFTGTFDCIVILEDTGSAATSRLLTSFSIAPTTITADTYAVDLPADGILRWTPVASTAVAAAAVSVDATGFTGNLSGTDTDVQTALDTLDALTVGSGGGASNVFIFDSSLATADNHYETWPELCAAYALVDGPKVIHVDGTETIPAGTWTCFGSEAVEFSGNGVDWFITGGSVLTVSDGVVFDPPPLGIRVTQGLKWSAESTDYIWQCDAGSSGIAALAGGTVACTYPIIRHDGGSTSVALLEAAAGGRILNGTDGDLSPTGDPITAGSSPLIDMVSGIAVTSQTYGIAHVSDDVFTGSASFGVTKIDTTAATNQPTHAGLTAGGSVTLLNSKAENESYDNGTSGLTATDVQAAIDEIVASGGGVSLGETSTTAYRGDRGKTAYDHSQTTTGNPHGTTPAEITGFDTAVRTSRLDQMAAAGADVAMGSHKITGLANGASSTDAAAFGQIPTASSSTPAAPGTAAAGSSTSWAKGDHVHPYQASVVGGQDEGTSVTSITDTSLLDAAIFISGQSTGDTVVGWFTFSHTNTSGSGRIHSIKPKLGATTLGTLSYNCPSGVTTSGVGFFVLRSEGASDHNFGAAVFTSSSGVSAFQTVTTENLSTGADLDLLGAIGAGGSQTNTLQLTSITRHRA